MVQISVVIQDFEPFKNEFSYRFFRWFMYSLGLICFSAMTLLLFKCSIQKISITFFFDLTVPLYNRLKLLKIRNAEENPDYKKVYMKEWLKYIYISIAKIAFLVLASLLLLLLHPSLRHGCACYLDLLHCCRSPAAMLLELSTGQNRVNTTEAQCRLLYLSPFIYFFPYTFLVFTMT